MTPRPIASVPLSGTGGEVDAEDRARRPSPRRARRPRLSTGSVASFTWLGTNFRAMTSATTASGSVTRNTEPHQKCSSRAPAISGPRAEMPPPIADQSAIDLVRDCPDQSAVMSASVVGKAMPAESPPRMRAATSTLVGRCVRREETGRDRQQHAEDQHHLAAVPVAQRTEVEHRRGQTERVADRDQVEGGLRRVERLADVGQGDVGDREVEVGDRGDEDQREEDERPLRRCAVVLAPRIRRRHGANPTGGRHPCASSVRVRSAQPGTRQDGSMSDTAHQHPDRAPRSRAACRDRAGRPAPRCRRSSHAEWTPAPDRR